MEAPATAKRVNSERNDDRLLWRIVTDHPDIFDTHIVPKLNGNDLKFFYDVNSESRAAIKRSGVHLAVAFKIRYFDTKSTLSWALEKCTKNKERFRARISNTRGDLKRQLQNKYLYTKDILYRVRI